MGFGEGLLLVAMVVTIGHALADVALAIRHAAHPMDTWLTGGSIVLLTGHVILTGEATRWLSLLGV